MYFIKPLIESTELSSSTLLIAFLNVERKTVAAKVAVPPTNSSQFCSVKTLRYLLHATSDFFFADCR